MNHILALYCILAVLCLALAMSIYKSKKESLKQRKAYKKLLSQKKSSEVRTGHIAEKLAPFLFFFFHDPECAVFLGQPIDYIVFEDEGVTFSEIKSGNSQLSKKQKMIKENIQQGNVFWEEVRIK